MSKYKMKADLRDAWIADLTSGKFAQTTGALYNRHSGDGYCCLGVLVCSAERLGHPVELNAEGGSDSLRWAGKGYDGGDYDPIQRHLFTDGMEHGASGFFAPFVRRNDGFTGDRPWAVVEKQSFQEIAQFVRDNVEPV